MKTKKLFIKTWGCQMNVYDSTRIADVLAPLGYQSVDTPEGADMIVLNTCHIREKATEKVFSELGRLRQHKQDRAAQGEKPLLAVTGCVAQAEGEEIVNRAPYVDLVFGPQTYHRLPEMVLAANGGERVIDTDFPVESKFDQLPEEAASQGVSAFLSVQEGCDKFCSFCVVPYTRGAEYSRPVQQVLAEARRMVQAGAREITLLGQNVNAYHGEISGGRSWGLGRLIRALAEIDGLARLRYTTSHPRDMDQELISAHADVPQLMPFLHLPVQSGSDRLLAAMNRKHTAEDYRRIVEDLRAARPDLALSSDFIVGFPGETEEDLASTIDLIREVGFAQAYSFKYSKRPGTPAAALGAQIPERTKAMRLQSVQDAITAEQSRFNARAVGSVVPVLLDKPGRSTGQLHGRTPHMQAVHVACPDWLLGRIVPVRIDAAHMNSLSGTAAMSPTSAAPAVFELSGSPA